MRNDSKNYNTSRRRFLGMSLGAVGLALMPWSKSARADDPSYVVKEEYQDVEAEWFGVNQIVIRAESIFIAAEVTGLFADEGSHKHALKISATNMAKLKAGQMIIVTTEVASGHQHDIKIDPNNKVPGGTIVQVKDPA